MDVITDKLLTVKETAVYLKLHSDTIYTLVKSKGFPARKIGRDWKIHKERLDKWIEEQFDDT